MCYRAVRRGAKATVSFTTAVYFPNEARNLRGIVTGDFNGDGILDLVVVNTASNDFLYLQGNGDGTFLPPVGTSMAGATSLLPEAIVAADFNGDGKLDIAISHPYVGPYTDPLTHGGNLITVYLGDGAGHFGSGIVITTGATPTNLVAGDFNGDGIPDLAVCALDDSALWIHLGNGDGTFKDPARYPIASFFLPPKIDIAIGDVNNDGHLDVVAVNTNGGSSGAQVTTFLGDGSGGFTPLPPLDLAGIGSSGFQPQIALEDINRDGKIDLVSNFGVFLGTGTGSFTFQWKAGGSTVADFDGDGNLDLASPSQMITTGPFPVTFSVVSVLTGDGMGNFPVEYDFGSLGSPIASYRMVAGDFNHDGRPDLAVSGGPFGVVTVMINTSPRGCDDSLNLTYSGGTLNMNFTLESAQPDIFTAWLAYRSNVVNLWVLPIPRVVPAVNFNVPIPGFPMIGNVGILTTLSNSTFGLVCFDWKTLDTGGVGATAQELKNQITKRGIVKSLP